MNYQQTNHWELIKESYVLWAVSLIKSSLQFWHISFSASTSFNFDASATAISKAPHFKLNFSLSFVSDIYQSNYIISLTLGKYTRAWSTFSYFKQISTNGWYPMGLFLSNANALSTSQKPASASARILIYQNLEIQKYHIRYFLSGILKTFRIRSACFNCEFLMQKLINSSTLSSVQLLSFSWPLISFWKPSNFKWSAKTLLKKSKSFLEGSNWVILAFNSFTRAIRWSKLHW